MADPTPEIDWSLATFEGSRRAQLRRWSALTVRQRLEALDEMTDTAMRLRAQVVASAPSVPTVRSASVPMESAKAAMK